MNTFYKWKVNTLSNIHKNKQKIERERANKKAIRESKSEVVKCARSGKRQAVVSFCEKEQADVVIGYFMRHDFKVIYRKNDYAYLIHQVVISW